MQSIIYEMIFNNYNTITIKYNVNFHNTAEEAESYFDPGEFKSETEEFAYLNDTNLETINFEVLANDEYESIKDKEFLASESLKSNYEEEHYDDILLIIHNHRKTLLN